MPNPTAAMLVIGDEILSGRTKDTNTNYLARALTEAGTDPIVFLLRIDQLVRFPLVVPYRSLRHWPASSLSLFCVSPLL